jgi:thiosulfate/3-mercaptopyruvate sulfurtransferase
VVESSEDVLLYETGHIPGAVKIDWHTELNDPVTRDYIDGATFAELMASKGISRGSTVVFYGDKANWWAAYALWVFTLFGHDDVRLLDGGRDKWIAEGRPLTTEKPDRPRGQYPEVHRRTPRSAPSVTTCSHTSSAGASWWTSAAPRSSPASAPTCRTTRRRVRCAVVTSPGPGACRGGVRCRRTAPSSRSRSSGSCTSRSRARPDDDVVVYCRIGERSSHSWFVLTHLLGYERVRNYDGSWTEWGNLVRAPIETGDAQPPA